MRTFLSPFWSTDDDAHPRTARQFCIIIKQRSLNRALKPAQTALEWSYHHQANCSVMCKRNLWIHHSLVTLEGSVQYVVHDRAFFRFSQCNMEAESEGLMVSEHNGMFKLFRSSTSPCEPFFFLPWDDVKIPSDVSCVSLYGNFNWRCIIPSASNMEKKSYEKKMRSMGKLQLRVKEDDTDGTRK